MNIDNNFEGYRGSIIMESHSPISLFFKLGILMALIGISYFKSIPLRTQHPSKITQEMRSNG